MVKVKFTFTAWGNEYSLYSEEEILYDIVDLNLMSLHVKFWVVDLLTRNRRTEVIKNGYLTYTYTVGDITYYIKEHDGKILETGSR